MEWQWMLIPFFACLVLSINHVYLGIHVIARKVIFVDLALAQIAALGATYAMALGYDPLGDSLEVSIFSLLFTFVGAAAFAIARMRKERVPQEAFIGIIYAAASAAAILILSKSPTGGEELKQMMVGDLLLVTLPSVFHMALLYGAIGLFHVLFRKKFFAISLDPEGAEAAGIHVRFWDILFYMSFGVVITKSVAVVGVLLVFSYLVVPAVIAQMWTDTVRGRLFLGWIVAIIASALGILWSFETDYPTGPAVVVMLALFLVLSSILYSIYFSPFKLKAAVLVALLITFFTGFFWVLSFFRKSHEPQHKQISQVELLLNEIKEEEEAHQLDGVTHLATMKDPRIVPALMELLERTKSDHVVEATVEALAKQKDPRAAPALQRAAKRDYDPFLKLSIAKAQFAIGDQRGFWTLLMVLKDNNAGFARHQAIELFETQAKKKFGYRADRSVEENRWGIQQIELWLASRGI